MARLHNDDGEESSLIAMLREEARDEINISPPEQAWRKIEKSIFDIDSAKRRFFRSVFALTACIMAMVISLQAWKINELKRDYQALIAANTQLEKVLVVSVEQDFQQAKILREIYLLDSAIEQTMSNKVRAMLLGEREKLMEMYNSYGKGSENVFSI